MKRILIIGCNNGSSPADSTAGQDCYDRNSNARPGQTTYYSTVRGTFDDTAGNTGNSYDYNCDGTEEHDFYRLGSGVCRFEEKVTGWTTFSGGYGNDPGCGNLGWWANCPGGNFCTDPCPYSERQYCR